MVLHGITFPEDRLGEFCRRHRVTRLALFGSILRDDFSPESDVDILIEFEADVRMGLFKFASLARELEVVIGREVDLPANRRENRGLRAVLNHLRVDLAVTLADAEDDGLPAGAPARLALDATRAEVRLVELDVATQGALELAGLGHAIAQTGQQAVDGVAVEPGDRGDLDGGEIGGRAPHEPAESGLRDPGTHHIAVSHSTSAYPEGSGKAQLVMTLVGFRAIGLSYLHMPFHPPPYTTFIPTTLVSFEWTAPQSAGPYEFNYTPSAEFPLVHLFEMGPPVPLLSVPVSTAYLGTTLIVTPAPSAATLLALGAATMPRNRRFTRIARDCTGHSDSRPARETTT